MFCSIIIPVLDDNHSLNRLVTQLTPLKERGYEIIVVDGGSEKKLSDEEKKPVDHFIETPKGRAHQMNAGAQLASGEILWFLHADSLIEIDAIHEAFSLLNSSKKKWGRFDVKFSQKDWRLKVVAFFMNRRSAITGIATGDQGIFVYRDVFNRIKGYPDIPLMEDVALSKSLRKISAPFSVRQSITTSGRRWLKNGFLRTILLMWSLRLGYFLGVSPDRLARFYLPCNEKS